MTTTKKWVRAIFPDGAMLEAPTFRALEDALQADEWNDFRSRREFRLEMANRANVWSGWRLNPEATAEMFWRGLEAAGLCRLDVVR